MSERTREGGVAADPATTRTDLEGSTEVGSVFVSNYPAYSFWSAAALPDFERALDAPPRPGVPLGLYLHIPFCRKRCKFCYFRVYTDKNADQVERYSDALVQEQKLYAERAAIAGRAPNFVYFGGGTPSYISVKHLESLASRLQAIVPWDQAEEISFECEPGTLSKAKLEAIRGIGVTRLSLGVESFNDHVLELNGRAHATKEIYRVLPWLREVDFPQVNIDLIAGMVGETWESWRDSVQKAIDFGPETVTIYQMELPFNSRFSEQYLEGQLEAPLADWNTKREWHAYAFDELAKAGYEVSSAYTMARGKESCRFVYTNSLWQGADMMALGVSSFGHISGVHFQNTSQWDEYFEALGAGRLAATRAFVTDPDQQLTREMILQLKLGEIQAEYFRAKFGVDIRKRFAGAFATLRDQGMLELVNGTVRLTRDGLLRVDSLLPEFYAPEYQHARYT
jgi:oxygen-independent coproporphyrinogen-3 oxidase